MASLTKLTGSNGAVRIVEPVEAHRLEGRASFPLVAGGVEGSGTELPPEDTLQDLQGWRDGSQVLVRGATHALRSAQQRGRLPGLAQRVAHGGKGLDRSHELERLTRSCDVLHGRAQELLGVGQLPFVMRPLTEHVQGSAAASAVAEAAQCRQALRHDFGRAVTVAPQPGELSETDGGMEHVAFAAGCFGQRPALGEPAVHLVVSDAGYHRDAVTGHGLSDAYRDAELLAVALDRALSGATEESIALASYQHQRDAALRDIFELTSALASYPPIAEFVELQKRLSTAIDLEAATVAAGQVTGSREASPA